MGWGWLLHILGDLLLWIPTFVGMTISIAIDLMGGGGVRKGRGYGV